MRSDIDIADLAEAVAAFIGELPLKGRQAFHAKVAQNALAIVAREHRAPDLADESAFYVERTGADPAHARAAFCRRIRDGSLKGEDVLAELEPFILARLAVDNPKFPTLARLKEARP